MQIKINYTNNHYILIQLFDNSSVRKWFNYFSLKNYNYSYHLEQTPPAKAKVEVAYEWNNIRRTVKYLNKIGLYLNFDLPSTFDYQQSTLNKLHRFFTYNMLWYDIREDNPNPFVPHFKLDNITKDEWHKTIDVINCAVHALEKIVEPTENAVSINPPIYALTFIPNKTIDTVWLEFDKTDVKQNYEYFNNIHYQHLVILDRSILGKCVLQSFSDDDDPGAADCTGRLGSHGGFSMDLYYRRQHIYQSSNFKDWVNTFNLDPASLPYEFPIGYVCESNFNINDYRSNLQFQNITFVGVAGEIRTHGTLRYDSFQDCCLKPGSATLP